jgi:hypothetical protein
MPTMNFRFAFINLRFLKILYPLKALRNFLRVQVFFHDSLEPKWSQIHDFLAKSPCFFGAKLAPEATPTRNRTRVGEYKLNQSLCYFRRWFVMAIC